MARVRIGSCRDAGEAALIRAVFGAHEIGVFISGENHAMMLGLGASAVDQVIWVDDTEAEDASALLRELREGGTAVLPEDQLPPGIDEAFDDDGDGGVPLPTEERTEAGAVIVSAECAFSKSDARRKMALAMLVGVLVGFGTAHMSIRRWRQALLFAGLEAAGLVLAVAGELSTGGPLALGAIVCDVGLALMWISQRVAPIAPAVARKKES